MTEETAAKKQPGFLSKLSWRFAKAAIYTVLGCSTIGALGSGMRTIHALDTVRNDPLVTADARDAKLAETVHNHLRYPARYMEADFDNTRVDGIDYARTDGNAETLFAHIARAPVSAIKYVTTKEQRGTSLDAAVNIGRFFYGVASFPGHEVGTSVAGIVDQHSPHRDANTGCPAITAPHIPGMPAL